MVLQDETGQYITGGALTFDDLDTLVVKNNLIVIDTTAKYIINLGYPAIPNKP